MNNLIEIGIDKETIDEMIENHGVRKIAYLNKEYKGVYRILDIFKQLLISEDNINSLLIEMPDIFSMDYNKFISKIRDKDLKEISRIINEDYEEAYDMFLKD